MTTRFRTRAFLICFIPFALLLASSFWMIQRFVQSTVRDGLHTSLRESQVAIANIHAKGDLQNSRFLKVAGENTALKAGMQLLIDNPRSEAARRTVEDQLRELGEHMGFDFMLISAPDGSPLAGVARLARLALKHMPACSFGPFPRRSQPRGFSASRRSHISGGVGPGGSETTKTSARFPSANTLTSPISPRRSFWYITER